MFLYLHEMTKVLLWSDQDGDEQLSSDDGPDSKREGTKCEDEGRDSERKEEGTDGEGGGWGDESKEQVFVWTDDEVELLHKYKVKKVGESVDWEFVRSKFSDIWEQLKRQQPSDSEEVREMGKDFPHKKEDTTKQAVTTKLKAVRLKYRQAVDSGQKSGHGSVLLLHFEWCEWISGVH